MDSVPRSPSGTPGGGPLLTLEPLLEAVREGVEGDGWKLSGLQKTTSHQFEGRWEGESSRSAYLFFHRDDLPGAVSLDVFLDETTRGLKGNLALVVDGPPLGRLAPVPPVLGRLTETAGEVLPEGYRTSVTLRFRASTDSSPPEDAGSEVRVKLHLPPAAMEAGGRAVSALASATAAAFRGLLQRRPVQELLG